MGKPKENTPVKSTSERLKESMEILKKLCDFGVPDTDPSYKEMSSKFNEWIKGGDAWQGTVDFMRFERRAFIVLPNKPGCSATCVLKQTKF
jgi:hypothetical protein